MSWLIRSWLIGWMLIGILGGASAHAAVSSPTSRIVGGEEAPECAFPTAIELGGCTGTLVHPKVVISAWHCNLGGTSRTIRFGESTDSPAFTVGTQACVQIGDGSTFGGKDFAFCVLESEVSGVPIVPILMGCETDILQPGQDVWMSGFGTTSENGSDSGTKRFVKVQINSIDDNNVIHMGGDGKAGCYGDSGGPTFVQLVDGSWRVFGIDSDAENSSACGNPEIESMMHVGMPWFESEVRKIDPTIDLTPCFDDDAKWQPSAGCGGFPMEITVGGGSWQEKCADNVELSGPSSSCGPAFDDQPPSVAIVKPLDGATIDHGQTLTVEVDAQDNLAVVEVELWIDDQAVDTRKKAPFVFDVDDLERGEHVLQAQASDAASNRTASEKVVVVVADDPSDTTTATTSETMSSSDGDGSDPSETSEDDESASGDDASTASDSDQGDDDDEGDDDDDGIPSDEGEGHDASAEGCACQQPGLTPMWTWLAATVGLSRRRRSLSRRAA